MDDLVRLIWGKFFKGEVLYKSFVIKMPIGLREVKLNKKKA